MKRLLVKNSVSGVLQILITLLFTFLVVKIFINQLGSELYGVFSLISILGNLNILSGLGITTSLIKYISEQGRTQQSHTDIITSFIIVTSLMLPISLIALFFREFIIISILSVPAKYYAQCEMLYVFLISANFFLFLGQIFIAVLDSLQMIFITNIIQLIYNFFYWGSILLVLYLKYSLNEIGLAILCTAIVWFVAIVIIFFKIWGYLDFSGLRSDFLKSMRKQLKYGSQIYTSSVISFFYEPFTKILISNFLGVKEVGFFDIALKLRNLLWNLIAKALQPLFPLISSIKEVDRIRTIVKDISQKAAVMVIPASAIIILIVYPLMSLWIGQDVEIIAVISGFIVSSYLIAIIYSPVYAFLMARHPFKTILIQSSNVIVNAVFFFSSYKFFGFYSIIIANTSAILFSTILCIHYQKKYLKANVFDSFLQFSKSLLTFIIILIPGYFISSIITDNLSKILVITSYSIAAIIISFRLLKIITEEDIERYIGEYPFIFNLTKKLLVKQK